MSGGGLYERYKDALKRGHVASLRGRLEESLKAYAEAAAIAPERSTPHTSAGTALMRRKRPADALRHYTTAVSLSPRDEAALLGRAQALTALDRRPEAANAFDALAELRATNGKLADAVDAARRGLELAEGRERRRMLEELIERLRASSPGEPGRLALERALQVLDGPAVAEAAAGGSGRGRGGCGGRRRGNRRARVRGGAGSPSPTRLSRRTTRHPPRPRRPMRPSRGRPRPTSSPRPPNRPSPSHRPTSRWQWSPCGPPSIATSRTTSTSPP